jgi:stage V sporulation protein SpoVS
VSTTVDHLSGSRHFDFATQTYTIQNSHVYCEALLLRHRFYVAHNTSVGQGKTRYFAKSCHNKLYPHRTIPEFGEPKDSQVRSHLVQDNFAVELTELLRDKRNIRTSSDSTDASGGSADAVTSKPIVDFGAGKIEDTVKSIAVARGGVESGMAYRLKWTLMDLIMDSPGCYGFGKRSLASLC